MANGSELNKTLEKYLGKNWLWTILGTLTIIIIMYAIFYFEAHDTSREILDARSIDMMLASGENGGGGAGTETGPKHDYTTIEDYAQDGATKSHTVELTPEKIENVTITFTFVDEEYPPVSYGINLWENQPDTFNIKITTPGGKTVQQTVSAEYDGLMNLWIGKFEVTFTEKDGELKGSWKLEVTCQAEDWITVGPLGVLTLADEGNDYDFLIDTVYLGTG